MSIDDTLRRRVCVYCGQEVAAWVPYRIRAEELSSFMRTLACVGSNAERFGCPHCGSTDRERHLRLYLERYGVLATMEGASILHVSPEPQLGALIDRLGPARYVRIDLHPRDASILEADLQQLPFDDESFDMLILNHTLEHVDDPVAALSEVRRVLRRGGRALCQTPFATRLTNTFADPLLQTDADRLFFYGQEDHVRLFGLDLITLINDAGLLGRLVPHSEILPDVDPESAGINEHEPFFDFVRP